MCLGTLLFVDESNHGSFVMDVTPEDAPGLTVTRPLRGFCHECSVEVVPAELPDDSFECPLCHEACVECPYESFEHWQGTWIVTFENGSMSRLTIDEHGLASFGAGNSEQLLWAPHEHEGFLLRLGERHHLRLESGGTLLFRCVLPSGRVIHGRGQRNVTVPGALNSVVGNLVDVMGTLAEAGTDWGDEPMTQAEGAEGNEASDLTPENDARRQELHRALDEGLQDLADHWPGLADADRQRLRAQMRQVATPLVGALANNAPLMQALGGAFAMPFPPEFFVMGPQPAPTDQAAPPALVKRWLDQQACSRESLAQDWQCPICFEGDSEELVAICRDVASGRVVHAFHRPCVASWLAKSNDCPTCRRRPIVTEEAVDATPGAAEGIHDGGQMEQ